ncbi:hypothetical protein AGMMS49983_08290 [Clostridia bacterium]|nr:hypothetical protein AGMMS49983_08290 [Clostridia bacterium]
MVREEGDKRVAVLIDAENISAKNIEEILNLASVEGRATVKRIYGDFSSESKSSQARAWNKEVSEHALTQVQQIQNSTGKNSSDSALIIDAMDLLYSDTIDVMCIVTNDSDFTRLAMRIAESGLEVVGMGTTERDTSKSFVNACTKFNFLGEEKKTPVKRQPIAVSQSQSVKESKEKKGQSAPKKPEVSVVSQLKDLEDSAAKAAQSGSKAQPVPKKVIDTIITAIDAAELDSDDWANIGPIGSVLYRRFPDFDPSFWNRPKQLSLFLKGLDEYFEVVPGEAIGKPAGSYIRIRT